MDSELEAGYLLELFNEPLYLMGYATNKQETESKTQEEVILKPEVKPIPAIHKIEIASQKIAKKCILLFNSEEDELNAKETEFLAKVMQASKLTNTDYECINFKGITITDIASRYTFDKLVLFGVKIPNLELNQYKCTQVKSTKIISADAVWMIESNNGLKKLLWEQLQVMFELIK
jgi:hypothetical protein